LRLYLDNRDPGLTLTTTEEQSVRQEREDFHQGSSVSAGRLVRELKSGGYASGANMLLAAAANRATSARVKQDDYKDAGVE